MCSRRQELTPAARVYAHAVLTTAIATAVNDAITAGMTAADIASVLTRLAELLEED